LYLKLVYYIELGSFRRVPCMYWSVYI